MNKRSLTVVVEKHIPRGMSLVVLLFIAIALVWLVQGQPLSSNISQISSAHVVNGTKTMVRVHDTAQRPQIISPHKVTE